MWIALDRKAIRFRCSGCGKEAVRPFFEAIGSEVRRRIHAVAMDMHAPFEVEVRAQCPEAEIVYDLFHVVMKYGREVIDRVRMDEANRENLIEHSQRVRLKELLEANQTLMTVYLLRDDLKRLGLQSKQKSLSILD